MRKSTTMATTDFFIPGFVPEAENYVDYEVEIRKGEKFSLVKERDWQDDHLIVVKVTTGTTKNGTSRRPTYKRLMKALSPYIRKGAFVTIHRDADDPAMAGLAEILKAALSPYAFEDNAIHFPLAEPEDEPEIPEILPSCWESGHDGWEPTWLAPDHD